MHILVTAASKHGATDEVADAIAKRLEAADFTVDRLAPADVTTVDPYDAVVVGSAVYILQWMPEAHEFMERFKDQLRDKQVWAFSVGMNGVPKHSEQDANRVGRCSLTSIVVSCVRSLVATSRRCCRCVNVRSRAWLVSSRVISAIGTLSKRGPMRLPPSCVPESFDGKRVRDFPHPLAYLYA